MLIFFNQSGVTIKADQTSKAVEKKRRVVVQTLSESDVNVVAFLDTTKVPFNGCKKKK